jgi:hypothetical protein
VKEIRLKEESEEKNSTKEVKQNKAEGAVILHTRRSRRGRRVEERTQGQEDSSCRASDKESWVQHRHPATHAELNAIISFRFNVRFKIEGLKPWKRCGK